MSCLADLIATTETGETPVKHPEESRLYGIDFTEDLEVISGEFVNSVNDIEISSSPTDLTFTGMLLIDAGQQITVMIGGGSHPLGAEREYKITVIFTTNMDQRKVVICLLIVGTP